jgi:hypothetical protein
MSLHPCHIVSLGLLFVLIVLAIAGTAGPWTHGSADGVSKDREMHLSLWRYKFVQTGSGAFEFDKSWNDVLDHDGPACAGDDSPTSRDILKRLHVAQAGAVLSIFSGMFYIGCAALYAFGKIRPGLKFVLLVPALSTLVFAFMAYGGYTSFYLACDDSLCQNFVDGAMSQNFMSAKCGPSGGPFIVWAAVVIGIVSFVLLIVRASPMAAPPANAMTTGIVAEGAPVGHHQPDYNNYGTPQPYQQQQEQHQQYPPQQQQYPPQQQQPYAQQPYAQQPYAQQPYTQPQQQYTKQV